MRDDEAPKAEAGKGLAACLWQRLEGARELAVGSELVRVLVRAVKERHVVTSRRLRTRPHVSSWTHGAFGVWLGGACSGEMLNSSKVRCTCVSGSGHEITQSHLRPNSQSDDQTASTAAASPGAGAGRRQAARHGW